ncbi:hypothetical protein D1AOALGA4SA_10998 [Olavius algarvensis Delta 1 endosymbiont]|nr:hypothetical protein D1AOALGA4SA_10998 [Olavius algarvensis Delta 1 endosymbiont]
MGKIAPFFGLKLRIRARVSTFPNGGATLSDDVSKIKGNV